MDRKRRAKAKKALAWVMLVGSAVSWPLASFWFAKDEPQFVIALSELALIYTAVGVLFIEDLED